MHHDSKGFSPTQVVVGVWNGTRMVSRRLLAFAVVSGLALAPAAVASGSGLPETGEAQVVHAVGTTTVVNDEGETLRHDLELWYQDEGTYRVVVTREDGTVSQELTAIDGSVYMVGRDPGGNPVVVFREARAARVDGRSSQVTFAVRPVEVAAESRGEVVDVHSTSASVGLATAWDVVTDKIRVSVAYSEVEVMRLPKVVTPTPPSGFTSWPKVAEIPPQPSEQELQDDALVGALGGNGEFSGSVLPGTSFAAPMGLPLHFATHFEGWKYFSTCARYYNYRSTTPGYFSGKTESTDLINCKYLGVALYGANVVETCNWVYWWAASPQQSYSSAYKSVTSKWPITNSPSNNTCSSHVAFNSDYVQTYGYVSNKNDLAG